MEQDVSLHLTHNLISVNLCCVAHERRLRQRQEKMRIIERNVRMRFGENNWTRRLQRAEIINQKIIAQEMQISAIKVVGMGEPNDAQNASSSLISRAPAAISREKPLRF